MTMQRTAQVAAVAFALFLPTGTICAQSSQPLITFQFEGEIDEVDDLAGVFGGNIQVGDAFNGSFSYDPTVADIRPDDDRWGDYRFETPSEFSWTTIIGDYQWTMSTDVYTQSASIQVINFDDPVYGDFFGGLVLSPGVEQPIADCDPDPFIEGRFNLMTGVLGDGIVGDELPIYPPAVSDFPQSYFTIWADCGYFAYQITGRLTALHGEDPIDLMNYMADYVLEINASAGIANSLDAKLDAALQALDDLNQKNDVAAINSLNAFINYVNAQSGNRISTENAEFLIAAAHGIIRGLENP